MSKKPSGMPMPGGVSAAKIATPEIQTICDKIKHEVQKKDGRNFTMFKAVEYTSQTVAGYNYCVKVKVGATDFVHIRVYQDLQQHLSLTGYKKVATGNEPLVF